MANANDAYRAIGRYVVEFSQLIAFMRLTMCQRLMRQGEGVGLVELAFGSATADQIATAFFDMCEALAPLEVDPQNPVYGTGEDVAKGTGPLAQPDAQEIAIGRKLRELVRDEAKRRNDYAHGDWWISGTDRPPALVRLKAGRKRGVRTVSAPTPEEVEKAADYVADLAKLVGEYGQLCFSQQPSGSGLRVRDVFALEGKTGKEQKIVRKGPKAGSA